MKDFLFCLTVGLALVLAPVLMNLPSVFAQPDESEQAPSEALMKLEGEIIEVEELKNPLGSAIYTVKDFSSGATIKLFADRYRALIQIGNETRLPGDVLGGSRATIIYQQSGDPEKPEIVFAKIASSYYA